VPDARSGPAPPPASAGVSILTLVGHDCDGVKEVVRNGTADHAVACRNGRRYRIVTTDGGLVRVTPG